MHVVQSNAFDPSSVHESTVSILGAPTLLKCVPRISQPTTFNKEMCIPLDVELFKTEITLQEANLVQKWKINV